MIYVELVPKHMPTLLDESQWITHQFPHVSGINIPDILRVPNRSIAAAIAVQKSGINALPHLRICDFSVKALVEHCQQLVKNGIRNVLLVSGDPPPNPFHTVYHHSIIEMIALICKKCPQLKVYAGQDPYRQNFKKEMEYAKQKLEAGASGLFTQPIFSLHLAEMLLEQCQPCEWFIGISPVLTDASHAYWVTRNNVVFPPRFDLSLNYNIMLANDILALCKRNNQHNYIMPITTPIQSYLPAILQA